MLWNDYLTFSIFSISPSLHIWLENKIESNTFKWNFVFFSFYYYSIQNYNTKKFEARKIEEEELAVKKLTLKSQSSTDDNNLDTVKLEEENQANTNETNCRRVLRHLKLNCCCCFWRLFRLKLLFYSNKKTTPNYNCNNNINNSLLPQKNTAKLNKQQSFTMTAQMASFLKLTLVGDGGVGKSCLILQYMYGDVSLIL